MHIHYQSKIQAKKALSKNGKILGNNIMVGVSACIDKVRQPLMTLCLEIFCKERSKSVLILSFLLL